jgi:hypothetical protein
MIQALLSKPHFPRTLLPGVMDPSPLMTFPLFMLALGAAFFGYITHELFLGLGHTFYQQVLFIHPNNLGLLDGS